MSVGAGVGVIVPSNIVVVPKPTASDLGLVHVDMNAFEHSKRILDTAHKELDPDCVISILDTGTGVPRSRTIHCLPVTCPAHPWPSPVTRAPAAESPAQKVEGWPSTANDLPWLLEELEAEMAVNGKLTP
jgi:hypothetical protein